ncbi:proline--tRNA ligase [Sulfuritalea sp.]|uniref:proline--tRNA ligase n=1 Tax=Sulfuritalea sp. TaxID=2480090 RepID=UPI001AD5D512|nr:proline--tRNA ligase [Sulfuritalea sp.]MBN8475528.1 proline--tRNA ligase [Sulfuritalea sp.]
MRASQFFIATLKEAPSDAEIVSHKLMLRAGLIRRLAGGIYTWMPMGLRVLRKVENIVREEMNRAGAVELLMPAVQPFELWEESGRGPKYGPELLRFKDRHQRDFVIGPTHEEVITDVVRREVKSYRQLPRHFYQVQTKFRDEIRPRFGVMRGREFLMKDGYSFHASFADLEREYRNMYETYSRIFSRLGLKFRAVAADTGAIGGTGSHEFHVLADSGEDAIAFCPTSDYAANVELAEAIAPQKVGAGGTATMEKKATPNKTKCEDVAAFLGLPLTQTVKAIAVMAEKEGGSEFVLLLLRGDHDLNEIKAQKVVGTFRFARDEEIVEALGCKAGYIGAVGFAGRVVVDRSVAVMGDMVCGANEEGFHLTGVNFGRDLPQPATVADIRNVLAGDPSPDGAGVLDLCRGIEVGHIFQLRTKYAEALKCTFLDEQGKDQVMEMGCYGIGVSRIVGAAIEQGYDERGIIFPAGIAPFAVVIVPMNYAKSEVVRTAAVALLDQLLAAGIDAILDDRDERPGSMFADWELIGVPHRVVVGERGLKEGKLEYKGRTDTEATMIAAGEMTAFLQTKLCG